MYWKGLGEERCWCWRMLFFFVKQAFYFWPVLRFNIKPFQLLFLSLQFSAFRRLRDEFLSGRPPDQTRPFAQQTINQTRLFYSGRPIGQTSPPTDHQTGTDRHLRLTDYQWASTFQSRHNQPPVRILRTSCNSGQVHSLWVGSREVNL